VVNNTGWSAGDDDFRVLVLPSMRFIADLSDLSHSVGMHTTGQSGHPFSEHYADMIDSWRNVEYHPMRWTRPQVEEAAASKLVLKPGE
jgi:penicillin amidase